MASEAAHRVQSIGSTLSCRCTREGKYVVKLSDLLASQFRGDIRFRGAAYVQYERVVITQVNPDRVSAIVRDGAEHQIELIRQDNQLQMLCTCPRGDQAQTACKHVWATILTVEEKGYLTGTPKPGYVPSFVDRPSGEKEDWDTWDGLPSDANARKESPRASGDPMPEIRQRDWEVQLAKLQEQIDSSDVVSLMAARERRLFYEVDAEQSWHARQLVVEVSQRQRLRNGQWGRRKPLKVRPGKLDDIEDPEDRRILASLMGSIAARTDWAARSLENPPSTHRFCVSHELCELLLPRMCATGRVQLSSSDEQENVGLAWDDGPGWELTIGVVRDGGSWGTQGRLCRDTESMSVRDPMLIVPGGLVVTDTGISRLANLAAFEWVELLRSEKVLLVQDGEEEELIDRLLSMPSVPRLELPEEFQLAEIRSAPVPHLCLHPPRGFRWRRERLRGAVEFDYLGTLIRGTSKQSALIQRDQGRCLLRDHSLEHLAWLKLQEHGFRLLPDRQRGPHDVEIHARDLGQAVRGLLAEGWQVRTGGKQVSQPESLQFHVKSGIDWFELHADVQFEGRKVAFPELLAVLARGDSTVLLEDGSLGILPEEWTRQYGLLSGLGVVEEDHLRFATSQVGLLDALLATQDSVDYDTKFQALRDTLTHCNAASVVKELPQFQGKLRGYQREGLTWLQFLQDSGFGGCLADDMGLGKTVQMLALLQARKQARRHEQTPSLIVVPKSLLFNWARECERFTPELRVLEYSGFDRAELREEFPKHDVILTTYGTLRRDVLELKECKFDYLVLDEAQMIKNAGSQVAKAARLVPAAHRLALTGTPIENHIGDLWSIFEFLNPGMLGRSSSFRMYAAENDDTSRKMLARGIRPFILRRTKQQVAGELPEKVEQTIHCDMGAGQARLYGEMRDHYRDSLLGLVQQQGLAKSKIHVLEALLRLRQAACHAGLLDKTRQEESSAKLDVLLPYLEELLDEGHKALVFSQFTSMLAIVKRHLDQRQIVYEYLDGRTRDRQKCVNRFQTDPECGLFLISLKAGGFGLNLTAADYVFLLDPWWNPAAETQAIDRAHRLGQTRRVFAYRLVCRNTVEEKITDLQDRKRKLADAILQESDTLLKDLSLDDLDLLLS